MLEYNPARRIKPEQALKHAFFCSSPSAANGDGGGNGVHKKLNEKENVLEAPIGPHSEAKALSNSRSRTNGVAVGRNALSFDEYRPSQQQRQQRQSMTITNSFQTKSAITATPNTAQRRRNYFTQSYAAEPTF